MWRTQCWNIRLFTFECWHSPQKGFKIKTFFSLQTFLLDTRSKAKSYDFSVAWKLVHFDTQIVYLFSTLTRSTELVWCRDYIISTVGCPKYWEGKKLLPCDEMETFDETLKTFESPWTCNKQGNFFTKVWTLAHRYNFFLCWPS